MTELDDLPAQQLLAASRSESARQRKQRDKLSKHIDILDDIDSGVTLPQGPAIAEVAAFFHVPQVRIAALLWSHRDEFLGDGWRPENPSRPTHDVWSPRAVVRAALLLDANLEDEAMHVEQRKFKPSLVAAQIRFLLGKSSLPLKYSTDAARSRQCSALFENAMRIAEHVHNEGCPGPLWAELQETERYDLQALVVALAALVPIDQPDVTSWLRELGASQGQGGAVWRGLARLIPQPSGLYRRRSLGNTRRRNLSEDRTARSA